MLEEEEINLKGKVDGITKDTVNGLEAIHSKIHGLQTGTLGTKPAEIGKAVEQIKTQLGTLRTTLQNPTSNNKDDVINRLKDMQNKGLGEKENEKWQPTQNGVTVDGLGKIHVDIKKLHDTPFTQNPQTIVESVKVISSTLTGLQGDLQNNVTEKLTELKTKGLKDGGVNWDGNGKNSKGFENIKKEINEQNTTLKEKCDDIDRALNKIRWELTHIGIKLDMPLDYDDVMDQLRLLGVKIGKCQKIGLEKIQKEISELQEKPFNTHPQAIQEANEAIKEELQKQRDALKSEVTEKLTKLRGNGLEDGGADWTDDTKDVSGLAKIKEEIDTAFTGISDYANAISVDHITSGLQKVSDNIKDHVGILTYRIKETTEAVQRKLQQFVSEMLFKNLGATASDGKSLQEIHDELHRLRTWDLGSVIKSLAAFDEYADRLRNETIKELTAFVSRELDGVAAELTEHERRHYVSSVQSALTFFANTVAAELKGLPRAIESDLEIGFKGFMSQAEGKGGKNINLLADEDSATGVRDLSYMFGVFFGRLMLYVATEIKRVHEEENAKKNPSLPKAQDHYADRLNDVHAALTALLSHLTQQQRYDHEVPGLLDKLDSAASQLRPEAFGRPSTQVLDGVVNGLRGLVSELRNVYISAYDGQTFECALARSDAVTEAREAPGAIAVTVENVGHLTPYGKKCAKVLLTIITIMHDDLNHLVDRCERDWGNHRIALQTHDQKDNPLGSCLHNCGYRVADDDAAQTAELRNDCAATEISQLLKAPVSGADDDRHLQQCASNAKLKTSDFHVIDIINCLIQHLNEYYVCCHLNVPQSPKPPCSVYEMLVWLSGLRHSRAYDALKRHVRAAVETEDAQSGETNPYTLAAPTAFSAGNMLFLLDHMTSQSYYLLVCILGTGDAHTVYASDFPNNSCKLQYPTDGEECFHLLLDILRRLFPPLKFLSARCGLGARHHGWAQCKYGKNVTPYTWQCAPPVTALPSPHPECTDKSPLMSYLNDCLPGHLPHQLVSVGCEPVCQTCPSGADGMPCLTPLGFRGFSGSTKTGKQLCKALTKFLCNDHVTCIFTLLPRPPISLPEHFGFALSLAAGTNIRIPDRRPNHETLADAFGASTNSLSLGLYKTGGLVAALTHAYGAGSVDHADCQHHHLKHLATHNFCTGKSRNMGSAAYLSSLCHDVYNHLAHRHSDLYLSWAVYLPWQLWQHLERLHGALCSISCHDWGCRTCLHGDTCVPGRHGLCDDMTESPRCHCTSVVQCSGVSPTLYNYGFTFRDASALNREDSPNTCAQLSQLLTNVLHSRHFTNLFHHCDQFLWEIRTPFLFTLVALWLTATLYIAHSLLYRMDVLRIRSHLLTTRASHLIDVKALLAGSRRMLSLYNDWIEAADAAVQAAKVKAEQVHGRLDHSDNNGHPKTPIGQGVKQIRDAKDKVKQVDDALQAVHTDLGNWKNAANSVLSAAVDKARDVHGKLDPNQKDKENHIIGHNISNIEQAKQGIVTANETLRQQVTSLANWITTADGIRQKAQEKAEEAYKKLDVNAELSNNVKKIVDANERIKGVHNSLNGVHGSLNSWNQQAGKVLTGAIGKATQVHDALDIVDAGKGQTLKTHIEGISSVSGLIKKANESLKTEVENLGKWSKAAKDVITKAEQKCEEILKRVDDKTKGSGQVAIKEHADELKKKAESLLEAYKEAYPKVQHLVEDVKNAVKDLEASMKEDLGNIRNRIVEEMKTHVGGMLGEIKSSVESIKGKDRGDWKNSGASGLLGIAQAVRNYATEFRHDKFAEIAKGWLEATILRYNGTVRRILGMEQEYNESRDSNIKEFAIEMKKRLKTDVIGIATDAFQNVNTVSGTIQQNITAVKTACEIFANALDEELYNGTKQTVNHVKDVALQKGSLNAKIEKCVCECDNCKKPNCGKKAAAELIMCALTSTVRQVGNELESVFLGGGAKVGDKSIASELDSVVSLTRTLDDNLGEAEKEARNGPQPPTSGNQDNEILNKVKGVEQQVKSAMKETTSIDENFKQIMPLYEAAKGENGVGDHKYHNLLKTDIPNALKDFAPHVDNGKNEGIIKQKTEEIKKHLSTIDGELQEIAGMVQHEKKQLPQGQKPDGVKDYLGDLRGMVTQNGEHSISSKLDDGTEKKVQGLAAIHSKIHGLQTGTLGTKPAAIDGAVTLIKAELGKLREKLMNKLKPGDDVINALTMLNTRGLGSGSWYNVTNIWNGGQHGVTTVDGLEKIQKQLQTQNDELPKQTTEIDEAIREITWQLHLTRFKLDHKHSTDDITDQLKWLGRKLGKNGDKDRVNLQDIYEMISWLQREHFTNCPQIIQGANSAIKVELGVHRSTLDKDVINTLEDLKDKGMSEDADWNDDNNAKGLENIENGLHAQQSELHKQPTEIKQGVDKITAELDELRSELQGKDAGEPKERGVMRNMEFMIEKIGTNDDDKDCLKKIKKDIEELNRDTVPDINKFLGELCAKIASEAGSVDWQLGLFKENDIDKDLEKIKSDIHTLRTGDLHKTIAMCDKFLTNADYIKWEKVENIERFVDSEIEKAIAELTKQARRDYVESAKDALKHFADKVAEELGELPGEINRDLFVGYKGFMRQMEGERSENINRLRNVQSRMLRALSSAFQNFFAPLDEYLRREIQREKKERDDEKNPSLPKSEEPYAAEWDAVHSDVNALLNYLCVTQGFDDRLRGLLHNLTDALTQLRPQGFQKPSTPTLGSVSRGLSAFAGEFGGAYISTYSGAECREADADKYAKVLLSLIPMTHEALTNLADKCGTNWKSNKICKLTGDDRDNGLGNYLTKCGFKVSPTDGLQVGELQNHGDMNGEQIHALLKSPILDVAVKMLIDGKPAENGINVVDLIGLLHNMLCRYLQVCHLKVHESPRYPCTVRDMLSWLSGLQYTPVADKLPDHCRALLNRKCDDNDAPNRDDAVMAQCINGLPYTIAEACSHADLLLIAIQGHGRGFDLAAYPYSVDFANNTAQLYYPDDPAEVLDMLRGIVCRLCSVLYFLYAQCCRATATTKGWRECHYGRQATDASHNCPPTSPLQSFLTDSCPSLLPHKLTATDNAIECVDCPGNQPGQQCLTPLGFWDLGLAASVARTGKELAKSLGRLCSDADACLFQLCRTLRLLCPSAPQSLGDVFALFFQMLRMWNHESSRRAYSHHESYLTHLNGDAINSLFPLWPQLHGSYRANLTDALKALAGHDHDNSGHNALSCLSAEPPCQSPSGCAPFLQPLALHANHTFPQKHAQLYVSWIVWLAWQLWELLESLLDALNNIDCTAHGCATCLCQPSNHNDKDSCHCPSLVECGGPLPTLYRYGFTYRNAHALLAGSQKIRCSDLNDQLTKALHSDHFTQLFHQIDQLLYTIRMPFLFCLVTLWLTATLYIAHSLCYRMDVLHIRSHLLTTRASHLIDVKALLAGSRRMLSLYSDVDYFDDDFHS
ncbi:Extracellular matrix-binding ebh [Babesia ovata]|uniref:Extracellular matrix-binding ebh n=1 Tax=Babesia ovata TaxID=189622 RepID=A0A2H6KK52_9APIC|nr:Extracellular matrix-binding ebh [Babesia ovata]GBE63374.1 Extracellular matrix-binding ebh [Babesia ovata]